MDKITYGVIREEYSIGGESRVAYGIAAYYDVKGNGTASIINSLHDICSDENEIDSIVSRFNRDRVSPYKLEELVEL